MEQLATCAAGLILLTVPLIFLEWRNWRHRKRQTEEISEMLERHREWIASVLPEED